ncbi:hypothetical protein FRC03_004867 [Tulasnella sp. 419]|nr:hypothetical protein FRC03_004867 [Tulasnella sp. 419]
MLKVQNNQEKPPDIEQQQTPPSQSLTMQPSDVPDSRGSGSDMRGSDLTSLSRRPSERHTLGPQFLSSQSVCNPRSIGVLENWVVSAASGMLLFTLPSEVIMYYTEHKIFRQINYVFCDKATSAAHTLSPDGNTLVRWILNENNQSRGLYICLSSEA